MAAVLCLCSVRLTAEATIAWEMAMENKYTPTALILTRQDVPDLKPIGADRYEEALKMKKGGYVVRKAANPDVTLVGNGSEVSLLCDVAVLFEAEGVRAQVVSVPSIGLFLDQSLTIVRAVFRRVWLCSD